MSDYGGEYVRIHAPGRWKGTVVLVPFTSWTTKVQGII